MADPGTLMMGASLAMSAFGSVTQMQGAQTQARGQREEAAAQNQMYQYQAGVAEINSAVAMQNADWSWVAGESQALQYGLNASQRMGQIKVGQAASGTDVNSGSNVDVRKSQKTVDDLSLAAIRTNTAKTAYDFKVQSAQYDNQAELYRMGGRNAVRAGEIAADATILGAVSSVSNRWAQNAMTFAPNIRGGSGSGGGPYSTGTGFSISSTGGLY